MSRRRCPVLVLDCLTIGKYQGEHLSGVPEGYLRWLTEERWVDPPSRRRLAEFIDLDQSEDGDGPDLDPDPGEPAVLFPKLLFAWLSAMRARFAGRPMELLIVEDCFGELKKVCSEVTGRKWPEGIPA